MSGQKVSWWFSIAQHCINTNVDWKVIGHKNWLTFSGKPTECSSLSWFCGKILCFWNDTEHQEKITLFPHYNFTFHFHCTFSSNQVKDGLFPAFTARNLNSNWMKVRFLRHTTQFLVLLCLVLSTTRILCIKVLGAPQKLTHCRGA